jgi:hypothetical protein
MTQALYAHMNNKKIKKKTDGQNLHAKGDEDPQRDKIPRRLPRVINMFSAFHKVKLKNERKEQCMFMSSFRVFKDLEEEECNNKM